MSDPDVGRQIQDIVDTEVQKERARQLQDLAAKAASLEADRERAREELEGTERRYCLLVDDARAQLMKVLAEQEDMRKDIAQLERQCRCSQLRFSEARELQEGELSEQTGRLEVGRQRLMDLHAGRASAVEAMRAEVRDLHQRLEGLLAERSCGEEAGHAVEETRALGASLEGARRQLEESEHRRGALQEKYLNAGQRFEQAIGASEKESEKLLVELQMDVKRSQERYDKYRRRFESVENEVRTAEATARAQRLSLDEKDGEIRRVTQALGSQDSLASGHRSHGSRWMQRQPRQLHDPSSLAAAIPGKMVPIPAHQQALQDQAERFRERLQELEHRLRREAEPCAAPAWERRERRRPPRGRGAGSTQAWRRSGAQAEALRAKLEELRRACGHAEAAGHRAERERCEFAESWAQASSHLKRLQRLVEDERRATGLAQSELEEVEAATVAAELQLGTHKASFGALRSEVADSAKLGAELEEQGCRIGVLEEQRDHLQCENRAHQSELSAWQGKHDIVILRLRSAERQLAQLDEQHEGELAEYRRQCGVASELHSAFRRRIADARTQVQRLRVGTRQESEHLQGYCRGLAQQCVRQAQEHTHRAELRDLAAERAMCSAHSEACNLEARAAAAQREADALESELEAARTQAGRHKEERAEVEERQCAQAEAVRGALAAVAAMLAGSSAAPVADVRGPWDEGSGGRCLNTESFCELLALFQEGLGSLLVELHNAVSGAAAKAATAEAAAAAAEVAAVAADTAAAAAASAAASKVARSELGEQRGRASAEVAERAGRLQAVRHEVQLQREESERLAAQLQRIDSEVSSSAEALCESAVMPVRQELRCVFHEVQSLQEEFIGALADEDRRGEALQAAAIAAQSERASELEEWLHAEASQLRSELGQERAAERGAVAASEQRAGGLRAQLSEGRGALEARARACQQLESECRATTQEEHRSRRNLEAVERRLAEAQEARKLEFEKLAQRRASLRRRQAQELAGLRVAKEPVASRPRLLLQQSLSSISSVPTMEEVDSLPADASGLGHGKLAQRAQQLGL